MKSAKVWTLLVPLAYVFGMLMTAPPAPVYVSASPQKKEEVKKLDPKVIPVPQGKVYPTGLVLPENAAAIRKLTWEKKSKYAVGALNKVTADAYDCRDLGLVPPVINQGNCGSCWDFSGTGIVTSAMIKAGYGKNDGSFMLSEQYILDCEPTNGGCNGDWQVTPVKYAQSKGIPTTADYGPYQARSGNCKATSSMKLYKVDDWGYCSEADHGGVAPVQAIKDAMVKYGPIAVAVAADNAFMNNPPTRVFEGNNRGINHAVILVGWKDDSSIKTGGYWIMRNSWGADWCDKGYIKIAYGANGIGTEAIWCFVKPLAPVTVVVPSVVGDTLADATAVLKTANLTVGKVTGDKSMKVTAQSPLPTTTAPTGSAVDLVFGKSPEPPVDGKPPFKLYEGVSPELKQVGTPEGYATIAQAKTAARTIASADGKDVQVWDSSTPPQLVDTVKPTPPGPIAGPVVSVVVNFTDGSTQVLTAITPDMRLGDILELMNKMKGKQ